MKISEMNNEQATEAMIRLAVPFENLCNDEDTVKLIERLTQPEEGITNIQNWGRIIPQIVTFAVRKHKNDLYEIVGALTQKNAAEVAKMNFIETINTVKESYDDVLKGFFPSSGRQMKKAEEKS